MGRKPKTEYELPEENQNRSGVLSQFAAVREIPTR
jgi:hypothetical protein